MKTGTLIRTIRDIQQKHVYSLGFLLSGVLPFASNLLMAAFFLRMFDAAEAGSWAALWTDLRYTSLLFVVLTGLGVAANYMFEYGVTKTSAYFRQRSLEHMQRLPYHHSQASHSGDVISRLTNDLKAVEGVYGENLLRIFQSVFGGIAALVAMFALNWQMAAFVSVLGIGCTVVNARFIKPLQTTSDRIQQRLGLLTERLADVLASTPITRVFGLEERLNQRYQEENQQVIATAQNRVKHNALMNSINFFTSFMGFGGLMVIGGFFVLRGQASFGEIVFMIQMQNSVNDLFNNLGNQLTQLQTSLAGARRVWELLDTPPEPHAYALQTGGLPAASSTEETAVELKAVSFRYPDGTQVLENVSLGIPHGKTYALVGSSGGGKSTILKLLLGFYPPDSGDIVLGGRSMSTTSLQTLRDRVAYVPQDSYLFAGSIADNIAYGSPDATAERIQAAARAAFAHDFILDLPAGYDTPVGERGMHLSGGQRQRIAIARAILKDAPILLLDEATSALDTESEHVVQKALQELMIGRTTVVVAHRLATVEQADQILVVDKGQIVEAGTHKELLQDSGTVYSRLYHLQYATTEKQAS